MFKFQLFVVFIAGLQGSRGFINLNNPIVFYDLRTKEPLTPPITKVLPDSEYESFNMSSVINIRLPFIGQPCGCESLNCGCCAGMMVEQFNFDQKMCMNFTYDPMEFAILMDMNMNENSVYSNMVSGKNPPELCVPIPTGPLPLGMEMCVKMFNIFTPGYNLHMCMDIMAKVQSSPIMVLHFDCMRFGQDSVAFLKPEENGGLTEVEGGTDAGNEGPMVVYDVVHDNKHMNLTKP